MQENGGKTPEFELTFDTGEVVSESSIGQFHGNVLVFNSDYIQQTIRLEFDEKPESGKVEISMPIGKESVEFSNVHNELMAKKKEVEEKNAELQVLFDKSKGDVQDNIIKFDTGARSDKIEEKFSFENATGKKEYEQHKAQQKNNREEYENVENNFQRIESIKEEFDQKFIPLAIDFDRIEPLLNNEEIFEDPSDEVMNLVSTLSRDVIEKVMKQYTESDDDKCPVCLGKFGESQKKIFNEYGQYLKSQKAKFEKNIENGIQTLEGKKSIIANNGVLAPELKRYIEDSSNTFNLSVSYKRLQDIQSDIDHVIECLKKKKGDPSISNLDTSKNKQNILAYDKDIAENNKSVETIQNKTQQVSVRKKEMRIIYANKLNIKFFEENKQLISEIQILSQDVDDLRVNLEELRKDLPSDEIKEIVPKLFNKFLKVVGIDKYELFLEEEQKFCLRLKTKNDKNKLNLSSRTDKISEGERNVLAFVYFLSSAIQKLKSADDFSGAIFILDDPICSMDYLYMHGICEIIRNYKERIKRELWQSKENMEHPQIILFTHNIKFFNLMHSHTWKDKKDNKKLELMKKGNSHEFEEISAKISEYEKSITALIQWKKDLDISEQNNCNIANDIRKIFDVLFVMHGTKERTINKMKEILGNEMPEDMSIFMNDGSHLDIDEATDIDERDLDEKVTVLLDALSKKYPDLLETLGYQPQNTEVNQ